MLLMGSIFQCLNPALTIATALAHRDPFVLPINRKEEADGAKRSFAGDSCRLVINLSHSAAPLHLESFSKISLILSLIPKFWTHFSCSDHIALLKAFEGWKDAKRNGRERAFCWDSFLSPVTLQMMDDMRMQFLDLLSDIGFVDKSRGANVSFYDFQFLLFKVKYSFPPPHIFLFIYFSVFDHFSPISISYDDFHVRFSLSN